MPPPRGFCCIIRSMAGGPYTRATTLFVDADHLARASLRRSLSQAGAPIAALEARDVAEMLDLAPHAELILLDTLVADGEIRNTLAVLQERCPGVPVVVVSGHNDPEAMRAALDGGAMSFLLK